MLCTFGSILLQCLSFFQPGFFSPSSSHPSSLTRTVATCVCPLENKSVCLAHLAASSSHAFFNLAFSAPPGLFVPSILPEAYLCGRAGPAQLSIAYLRKLFEKDGLWTQPTLFGRGELTRMVQPMHRLRCQSAERV